MTKRVKYEVYDSANKERLLGHLSITPRQMRTPYFSMAVMPRMRAFTRAFDPVGDYPSLDTCERVEFKVGQRNKTDMVPVNPPYRDQRITTTWDVFLTSVPMATLVKLDCFTPAGMERIGRNEFEVARD